METAVWIEDRLEGRVRLPREGAGGTTAWAAVVTHPHPKLGGDLRNNVTEAVCAALSALGVATVRFNTRGVGRSKGSATWRGVAEREDVAAAVRFARGLEGVERVALVAYSFGAAVGLAVSAELAEEGALHAVVAIGYPKGVMASVLFSSHYPRVDSKLPKLFVIGDRDEFASVSTIQSLVDSLSEPKQLVVVEDTDHFCAGTEHRIVEPIKHFFVNKLLTHSL